MRASMGRIVALVGTCIGLAFAMSAPAAQAEPVECSNITGSGSSLQKIGQQLVWGPGFEAMSPHKPFECKGKPTVTYTATSSGHGEACFGAVEGILNEKALKECGAPGTLEDYIGTDIGPEASQIAKMDEAGKHKGEANGIIVMPVAQSAISVIVAMPVGCEPKNTANRSKVENEALSNEWLKGEGKMEVLFSNWKGCPAQAKATLFARKSNSGTTAGFKHYLVQVSNAQWKLFDENAKKAQEPTWPQAAQVKISSEKGQELAETVFKTPASIGYADLADARTANFKLNPTKIKGAQGEYYVFIAEVQNSQPNKGVEKFASPESEASGEVGASNCKAVEYATQFSKNIENTDWSNVLETNAFSEKSAAYPICTMTYDVVWQKYKAVKTESGVEYPSGQFRTEKDYFSFILNEPHPQLGAEHYAETGEPYKKNAKEGFELMEE
jgi:ABC-type phosphate transport system substrate-binding protein